MQGLDSCTQLCMPCTSLLHPFQRESFMLFLLSFETETDSVNALLVFCLYTYHHSKEEKQLKLILTFTVPSIHNEIHSSIHERIIIENFKTMSTTCIGSIFPPLYSKKKWLQLKTKNLLLTCCSLICSYLPCIQPHLGIQNLYLSQRDLRVSPGYLSTSQPILQLF
jgi:hypothetical protein